MRRCGGAMVAHGIARRRGSADTNLPTSLAPRHAVRVHDVGEYTSRRAQSNGRHGPKRTNLRRVDAGPQSDIRAKLAVARRANCVRPAAQRPRAARAAPCRRQPPGRERPRRRVARARGTRPCTDGPMADPDWPLVRRQIDYTAGRAPIVSYERREDARVPPRPAAPTQRASAPARTRARARKASAAPALQGARKESRNGSQDARGVHPEPRRPAPRRSTSSARRSTTTSTTPSSARASTASP